MEAIIAAVSDENKEWIAKFTPQTLGKFLDAVSLIPGVIEAAHAIPPPIDDQQRYSKVSTIKGLQAENEFEDLCIKALPDNYIIENVAKKSKTGDFVIERVDESTGHGKYKMLVDVKNYKHNVPSKEIEKFYRDIECNQSTDCGMLISYFSRFSGIRSSFKFEEKLINNQKIPILYLQSNDPQIIIESIKFMFCISAIKRQCYNPNAKWECILQQIHNLEDTLDAMSRMRSNLLEFKLNIEKQFLGIMSELTTIEYCMKTQINTITTMLA